MGQTIDIYVWEWDEDGNPPPGPDPGNVILVFPDIDPGPVAMWPDFSTHDFEVCCDTDGQHFVGYWPRWPGDVNGWFIAADEDGPGLGCPRNKFAPGIGYLMGWGFPGYCPMFYDCKALGIREFAGRGDCPTSSAPDPDSADPDAPRETTWGQIKALH